MQDRSLELTGTPLRCEQRVVVAAPADYIYRRWTDFSHFPEFMDQVKEIRPIGADRYHWVAAVLGERREWDATVTDREINRRVAWQSLNGPHHAVALRLTPLDGTQTEVVLRVEHAAPEGQDGATLDDLRQTVQREMRQNLERFQHSSAMRWSIPATRPTNSGARSLLLALAATTTAGVLAGGVVWLMARRRRKGA